MTWLLIIFSCVIVLMLKAWFSSEPAPSEASIQSSYVSIQPVLSFLELKELEGYAILEQNAHRVHPDAPVKISLQLNDGALSHVQEHIRSMAFKSRKYLNKDQTVAYEEFYRQGDQGFEKNYTASHVSDAMAGYTFFMARLNLNFDTGILQYAETGL